MWEAVMFDLEKDIAHRFATALLICGYAVLFGDILQNMI